MIRTTSVDTMYYETVLDTNPNELPQEDSNVKAINLCTNSVKTVGKIGYLRIFMALHKIT